MEKLSVDKSKTVKMVSSLQIVVLCAFACLVIPSAFGSRAHKGFFDGLSEEQKEQVSTILHGGSTKAEIKEKLKEWVSTQPKQTQVIFHRFFFELTNDLGSI